MSFDLLPFRIGGAAENMATDFLLLQHYPAGDRIRFRHYGWHRAAFTFGYSQKIDFIRAQLPKDEAVELCRRPTGGGLVDHRNDWTYTLIIPRRHEAHDLRATESYRRVHASLVEVLRALGEPVVLREAPEAQPEDKAQAEAGICFTRTEIFDVRNEHTGLKVAGAAQKRNKHGLLFQGSVAHGALSATLDWAEIEARFVEVLASSFNATTCAASWPDWAEGEHEALIEQYSSTEWNDFR